MRIYPFLALILALPASFTSAAAIYKFVAPDGSVVYSDAMPNVQRYTTTRISTLSPAVAPDSAQPRAEEDRPAAETARAVAGRNEPGQTVLFTNKQCAACDQARAYLLERHVPFYEFDIGTSQGYQSLIETGAANKGAPVLVGRNYKLQGFSPKSYDGMFARRAKPAEPPAVRDAPQIQQASRPALQPASRPAPPVALTEGRQLSQLD
jgi:hypothetical protein